MNRSQIFRGIVGVCLTSGGFGLLAEAAQDSSGEAFRTIGMIFGAALLVAGLALAGPVVKLLGERLQDT